MLETSTGILLVANHPFHLTSVKLFLTLTLLR